MAASSSTDRSTSFVLPFRRIGGALPLPTFCNPAFSLSLSSHDRIVDSIDNISNRFESARGAAKKARRILLTSRLLISGDLYPLGERAHTDQRYYLRTFYADVSALPSGVHCSPQLTVSLCHSAQLTIMSQLGNELITIPNFLLQSSRFGSCIGQFAQLSLGIGCA